MEKAKRRKPIEVNGVSYPSLKSAMESNGLRCNCTVYKRFMDDTGMHFKTAILSDKKAVEAWLGKYIEKRKAMRDRKAVPVEVFGKVYKSKKDVYKELKPNCSYDKFLVEIRKYDCDAGKAIEKLLREDHKNLKEREVEVLGMTFNSRNEACRQLGVNMNIAKTRGKRGFCLIDCIFGKPEKGKRYLTDDMVKGIIGNRLIQGYDYSKICDILFDDAEVVIDSAMRKKVAEFKEVTKQNKSESVWVFFTFSVYLKIFEGSIDFTKLDRMIHERSKFQERRSILSQRRSILSIRDMLQ